MFSEHNKCTIIKNRGEKMANVDIKNLEYKKPNEEELKEIRKNLFIHNRKVFLVRFLILFIAFMICMLFQYFGQFHRYSYDPWRRFLTDQWLFYVIFIFLNILSLIPLIYTRISVKDIEFHRFNVLKKIKVSETENAGEDIGDGMHGVTPGGRVRYKYLMVTDAETGNNVVGKVFISGPMEYSSVREGDEVIAEKIPYEDHHRFYYVTAMYTKRK